MKKVCSMAMLLAAVGLASCHITNPEWIARSAALESCEVDLVRKSQIEERRSKSAWQAHWNTLNDEERRVLTSGAAVKLSEVKEFVYEPRIPETWRPNSLGDLRLMRAFPVGDTRPGEIQPFKEGELDVSLNALGGDWIFWKLVGDKADQAYRNEAWYRNLLPRGVGANASLGASTVSNGEGQVPLFLASTALVLDYDLFTIETGYIWGYSPEDSLNSSEDDQDAWYVGARIDNSQLSRLGKAIWKRWTN